jgi:hypothetical protein
LREQLVQAHERDRENRRIIAALTSRIPAIEASPDAPGSPETASDPVYRETPFTEEEASQEGAEPRSGAPWWRRMFGR